MESEEFIRYAGMFAQWMADYLSNTGSFPVKADLSPGDVKKKLPINAPEPGNR